MQESLSKDEILNSLSSPYDNYCVGYPGHGNYLTALVIGTGTFKETFSHAGSSVLDKIISYDRAEIDSAYMGQINMSFVSSFCGPQGLIWGYDVAKEETLSLPSFVSANKLKEFEGIQIRSGENLRRAATILFGTNDKRHLPFLPGSHVPCAGRTYNKVGPTILYAAIAIGIPEDRKKTACLLMEDIGEIMGHNGNTDSAKEKILIDAIRSVIAVGENQRTSYKEIFVDIVSKKIEAGEMGCALIAMPYFLLAKKAFNEKLINQNLRDWEDSAREHFLCNQSF